MAPSSLKQGESGEKGRGGEVLDSVLHIPGSSPSSGSCCVILGRMFRLSKPYLSSRGNNCSHLTAVRGFSDGIYVTKGPAPSNSSLTISHAWKQRRQDSNCRIDFQKVGLS